MKVRDVTSIPISIGKYHTQGLGATRYARMEAQDVAEAIENEFNTETYIGEVTDRKFREFTQGGPYGGYIPVFTNKKLAKEKVREAIENKRKKDLEEMK